MCDTNNEVVLSIKRIDASIRDVPLPRYMTPGAAAMDLAAAVPETVELAPGETALIPTGFKLAVPVGFEAQIRPRSGLALKYNLTVLNTPGTIDSDYRGEVKIILSNFGRESFQITRHLHMMSYTAQRISGWQQYVRLRKILGLLASNKML